MNILALDVGVAVVKAAVLNAATGQPRGEIVRAEYALDTPTADAAEVPAARLWDTVASAARRAVRLSGVVGRPGDDVAAVGLSTFAPALVLLGKDDQPLGPIWTHLDRRARPTARQVEAHVGAEFLASVGNRPLPGRISALSWRHQLSADPYLSHRLHSYLHLNGWLAFHLTGTKAFDAGNASFTGLYGTVVEKTWSSRWCDYFEVDPSWLPPLARGDADVGTLRAAVAHELAVPAGLPVKMGTSDLAGTMRACRMETGDVLHIEGPTPTLAVLTDHPVPMPRRLTCQLDLGAKFAHIAFNPVGDAAVAWLHRLCFRDQTEQEFFGRTISLARQRATRVSFDPPFLDGAALEIEAHRAALRDLELTTDRLDILAAVLEALVRRQREAIAHLGAGSSFRRVFVAGGSAKLVRALVPEYATAEIHDIEEGSLLGVARLFVP